ncbi:MULTISPECIES: polysaccharide pyruvyl transferase family protein [Sphingobacterium]|uniref:Polysaccharide pyruvyl transferase family protein n=1 Tax=Sphingobacterium populi TaxID=1812824 RepID=A0ABW5UAX3_9SPHI|nr:polysaccharide pyruvyl transferase family protein [Sphingobacterium sp. CFCC 11742]
MKKTTKVGLLTMHKVINYGSFLQAYATQTIIGSLGYVCEIIDYKYPNQWQHDRGSIRRGKLKRLIHQLVKPFGLISEHRKEKKIIDAMNRYYNLSVVAYNSPEEIKSAPPEYDIYLTGSDQTWNARFTKGDPTFLLGFVSNGGRKVSFSSSLASNKIEEQYINLFKELLSEYDAISVRENNGVRLVESLASRTPPVTLDPTLVLTKEDWKVLSKSISTRLHRENYILFYMLSYAFEPRPYIYQLLKYWQEQTGLIVLSFTKIPAEYEIRYIYCGDSGIPEYLHYFEHANYVVTSSFHGTAFAVNFGIPLLSVVSSANSGDDRQSSFLTKVKLTNCIVPIGSEFDRLNPVYDEIVAWDQLNFLRKESLNYLKYSLDKTV